MKVTVFTAKGGAGKTPISVNMVLDRGWAIGTNETYHVLETMRTIPDSSLLVVAPDETFPKLPPHIDIVFDLGGAMGGSSANSIRSAVEQSDLVIIPVFNQLQSINSAYHTIDEVKNFNQNILIVATKLEKQKNESFVDWDGSRDFLNIRDTLHNLTGVKYPVLPLKSSKGFDAIFDKEKSLRQMVDLGGIDEYTYRLVAWQFDKIYEYIDKLA